MGGVAKYHSAEKYVFLLLKGLHNELIFCIITLYLEKAERRPAAPQ